MTTSKLCGCGEPIKLSTLWDPHFLCADCEERDAAERKAQLDAYGQTFRAYDREHNEGFCPKCGHPVQFMSSMFGDRPLMKCYECESQWTQARWQELNPGWINRKEE